MIGIRSIEDFHVRSAYNRQHHAPSLREGLYIFVMIFFWVSASYCSTTNSKVWRLSIDRCSPSVKTLFLCPSSPACTRVIVTPINGSRSRRGWKTDGTNHHERRQQSPGFGIFFFRAVFLRLYSFPILTRAASLRAHARS